MTKTKSTDTSLLLSNFVAPHDRVVIIQAENPDGDSLGSALGLEAILSEAGKQVDLYCSVDIPRYLRYLDGWDRVTSDFPVKADAAIIVDTVSDTLLSKLLNNPVACNFLDNKPVLVMDHHADEEDQLQFEHELLLVGDDVATGQTIARQTIAGDMKLPADAATALTVAILSDSLGLTTPATTADCIRIVADLVDRGANIAQIETDRRAMSKKSAEILTYKGRLIERIEYHLDGKLALIHIPWDEIQAYSDQYNPSVLVLDEMRLVEGVEVAIAVKTYPDQKLTGKLRANLPVCQTIAGYFGGGGHEYAAGFRIYENYEQALPEIIKASQEALDNA